ncbi:MAG: TIGR02757 family protein [Chitinophagaceae bacterium]|nr:MAG: TIGR02757 family protein [Chitinophagaceae bacterium]
MEQEQLIAFLNKKSKEYNKEFFIENDPISVPHRFKKMQDVEIAGFFAAIFSWGNRKTIIKKSLELMQHMEFVPHDFCKNHSDNDLKKLLGFKHRTFNATDLLYFLSFLKMHYTKHSSLETAFVQWMNKSDTDTENGLNGFYNYFFSLDDVPKRTLKHIAAPHKNSACKRLNMYLRWMVRKDKNGVDFGLWNNIKPGQLIIPLDVHVAKVARALQLVQRRQNDWKTATELTATLRLLDAKDPVKYDFALFGLGVLEKF